MAKTYRCVLMLVLMLLIGGTSIAVAKVPEAVLAKKKAVVTLYIEQNKKTIASGSGFIIAANGIVVTNNHVIEPWNKTKDSLLYIKNSYGTFLTPIELIAADASKDVALLKVKETNLPFIQLSDSTPKEGEDVVVIGSPLGLETTITSGIISSIRGEDEFLQISAPISPGSSGSPVLNSSGEAIGMATLLMKGGQNLNFAIPTSYIVAPIKNLSKEKLEDLEKRGILELEEATTPAPPPVLEMNPGDGIPDHFVKILSLKDSAGYTYVEYDEDGTKGWVAIMSDGVAKEKLVPGDYIVFPDSAPMVNFQSKGLGRTFDKLIFAAGFRAVKMNDSELKSANDKDAFIISKMIDNRSYTAAANKINKVLEKDPNNPEMYFLRAKFRTSKMKITFEKSPDYQQILETNKVMCQSAYDDLSYAISLNNKNDKYYAARGALLTNSYQCNYNDPENAINDYEAAISLNPKKADYYISKGYIHKRLRHLSKLLECAKEAVKLNPNNETGYYLYGNYYLEQNDYGKALEYGKKSLMLCKDRCTIGTLLIDDVMSQYKKYDEAVKLYSDLIKKFPKYSLFYGRRGKYYLRAENYKKAIADFTKAIGLDPNTTYYYLYRGDAYRADGNFNAALSDYIHACDTNNSYACENVKEVRADIQRGSNWIRVGATNNLDFYFDKTSIIRNKNGNITVWVKGEITNKEEFISALEIASYEKGKYNNVSHILNQQGFNCQSRQIRSLKYILYSDTGNILNSHNGDEAKFTSVIPDSIGASMLDNVCKFNASKKTSGKDKRGVGK